MKKKLLISLCCCFLFLFQGFSLLSAQVTIGSEIEPEKANLLDLKTQKADLLNNATTDKNGGGLLLPRVKLQNRKTLEPFISQGDNEWINAPATKIKEKHAGLTVYNINVSPNTETEQDRIFTQGVYTWNGQEWEKLATKGGDSREWFYMPAFNLPVEETGVHETYDLYAEYERQFTRDNINNPEFTTNPALDIPTVPISGKGTLYRRDELDYAVVYYDKDMINITGIDNNGVMSYWVLDNDPRPGSFITIIFIPQ